MNFFWTQTPAKAPVLTPCIGICTLRPDGLCQGCLRTGSEIAAWGTLPDAERLRIMQQVLPGRAS
jgi:predicted Fe-S protein YdhL (DUF1289 family)